MEKVSSESVILFASPSMCEPADVAAPPALPEGMAVATVAKGTEPLIWSTCPLALHCPWRRRGCRDRSLKCLHFIPKYCIDILIVLFPMPSSVSMSHKTPRYSAFAWLCQKKMESSASLFRILIVRFVCNGSRERRRLWLPPAQDARIRPGPGRAHSSAFLDEPVGERNCDGLGLRP